MGRVQFEAKGLGLEDPFIHHGEVFAHSKVDVSLLKDISFQIQAGSDFGDSEAFRLKTQHAAFSDVENPLFELPGSAAAESDVFNFRNKLFVFAFFGDSQLVVFDPQVQASGREVTAKKDRARRRRDVDKSATARRDVRTEGESRDIHIPVLIDLKEGEAAAVKAAALKESELVRRRHDRVRVGSASEGKS